MAYKSSIKITGENEYRKALKDITSSLKLVSSEMKLTSTEFNNGDKTLKQTKSSYESMNKSLKEQKDKVNALKEELKLAEKEYGANNEQVKMFKTQLNNAENQLKQMESQTDKSTKELVDMKKGLDDVEKSSKNASDGFTIMKGALANLVADGFRKAIDGAKEFASSMLDVASEVKAENSQFEQTFGDLQSVATESIGKVASASGILETRLNSTASSIYAFARSSGATTEEAMELMESSLLATADASAYYDRSLEETADTLQSFLKGNFSNDAQLGVSATEFTRNAKATELFGKKYNELTEIQKQKTLLKMVTDAQKLSGAMGQASREADGWENVQGNLNESWRQFKANVGTPVLEALIPVIQDITKGFKEWSDSVDWEGFGTKVSEIAEAIKTGFGWIIDNKDILIAGITGIATALGTLNVINMITGLINAFKAWKLANEGLTISQMLLNAVMKANSIGLVISAIAGLVAGFVVLWNTSEEFRNFWISLWNTVVQAVTEAWNFTKQTLATVGQWVFDNVITPVSNFFVELWGGISSAGENAWNFIKGVWGNVSSWFSNTIIQPVSKFFSGMWDGLKNGASQGWQGIKSVFSNVASWFKNTFTEAWNNVKNVFSTGGKIFDGIKEGIASTFKSIVNRLISGINRILSVPFNKINSMLNKIRNVNVLGLTPFSGLWGYNPLSVPQIPQLFEGGILRKGEIGLLEGRGAEAVVPLHNNKKWISAVAKDMNSEISSTKSTATIDHKSIINDFKTALKEVKVVMDDREMGTFVTDTMERVIYT